VLKRLLRHIGPKTARPWLARAGRGRLIVLCYHDLRKPDDFTSWLRVEVGAFREHLHALSEYGRFISPTALDGLSELPHDRLNFLLTFDDGYLNNLQLAAEVLEEADVPALFFVSTHHLITGEPFWFDRVVTRVQAARLIALDLSTFGLRHYRFFPDDGARRWDTIQVLLTDLKRLGNPDEPALKRILDFLDAEYGPTAEHYDARLRPLHVSELKQLANRPQAFFGSHGHRHEILTRLTDQALTDSVVTSKQILERLVNAAIVEIAYPNGDEDPRVRSICARAGYRRGFLTTVGMVPRTPDILGIPRLLVGGYDTARDILSGVNALLLATATNELFGGALARRMRGTAPNNSDLR
jgi:peptidoglycan/xylan/chitin deacetylase (PgdA/CDA1 family)